jgi:hypothetical protein
MAGAEPWPDGAEARGKASSLILSKGLHDERLSLSVIAGL